ncbi:hypothetical protein IE81DRAFT_139136 [Ceraceosorus guamensis]|uniref:Uncharacterized protein n=1 Tax=Ceraceosorus guamensis TaxID=1522189 RepID=A0A316VXY1_9BASI|nr:hypothetical protein IE81DRAFT_139136 [Ceraceosorus guamensis]PWN42340.1 hypothetical protein IE81DRAFT_139136 [Ceraceosorus guamensis]
MKHSYSSARKAKALRSRHRRHDLNDLSALLDTNACKFHIHANSHGPAAFVVCGLRTPKCVVTSPNASLWPNNTNGRPLQLFWMPCVALGAVGPQSQDLLCSTWVLPGTSSARTMHARVVLDPPVTWATGPTRLACGPHKEILNLYSRPDADGGAEASRERATHSRGACPNKRLLNTKCRPACIQETGDAFRKRGMAARWAHRSARQSPEHWSAATLETVRAHPSMFGVRLGGRSRL